MKKIFWIIGTIIVCILYAFLVGMAAIGISIITRSEIQPLNQDILNPIMAVGWGILIVLSILMWKRWNMKCHACKRWAALKLCCVVTRYVTKYRKAERGFLYDIYV